ncbi:MAG TPA: MFS transporter [Actinomycetes bacterium]|jgi:MFS family permease|nr:MFS transporter [Actinomycetes bacterium]
MRLRVYLDVLRTPSVSRLLGSAVVGRMPTAMAGLAIVLLVREAGASYAVAGLVAGAYSIALALTSPLLGRLVDRVGQTRVLVGCAGPSALSFGALAAAGRSASPAVLAALAALAGASSPPVAACMRALWSKLLGHGGQLQAAFAVESTVQELIFVVGPPLVALLAAVFSPAAAVLGTGALLLVGVGVFAATPASRAWRGRRRAADWAGPLRSPGIRAVMASIVLLAGAFGTVEVTVVADAEQLGSRTLAGPLLALWAAGSMVGGLSFGSRASDRGPEQRMIGLLLLVVAGIALLAVAGGLVQLGAGMVLAGLGIAPAIACLYLLVDRLAPAGTVTEAFTWVTTAFATGFAGGNALGGTLVQRVGIDAAFLIAAGGVAAAALLARLRRHALAAPPAGMPETREGLGRAG